MKRIAVLQSLILTAALAAAAAHAVPQSPPAVFKCTLPDGHVIMTDRPCTQGTETIIRVPVAPPAPAPASVPAPTSSPVPEPQPSVPPAETDEDAAGAGATAAYAPLTNPLPDPLAQSMPPLPQPAAAQPSPPPLVVVSTPTRPSFVPTLRYSRAPRTYPAAPLATDAATLKNAYRTMTLLDGLAPKADKPPPKKKKRLLRLFSRKDS